VIGLQQKLSFEWIYYTINLGKSEIKNIGLDLISSYGGFTLNYRVQSGGKITLKNKARV
jgi:hypothetical protein